MKPLVVNLDYPSLDGIKEDKKLAYELSCAYAGKHGELNAILQYLYHYFYFNRLGEGEMAQTLMGIGLAEMHHLEILGQLILSLGIDPIFASFPPFRAEYYSSIFLSYSKSARKMLLDDISGEMVAISEYEQLINKIKDEQVQAILLRIKLDEELHAKVLKEYMQKFCR